MQARLQGQLRQIRQLLRDLDTLLFQVADAPSMPSSTPSIPPSTSTNITSRRTAEPSRALSTTSTPVQHPSIRREAPMVSQSLTLPRSRTIEAAPSQPAQPAPDAETAALMARQRQLEDKEAATRQKLMMMKQQLANSRSGTMMSSSSSSSSPFAVATPVLDKSHTVPDLPSQAAATQREKGQSVRKAIDLALKFYDSCEFDDSHGAGCKQCSIQTAATSPATTANPLRNG